MKTNTRTIFAVFLIPFLLSGCLQYLSTHTDVTPTQDVSTDFGDLSDQDIVLEELQFEADSFKIESRAYPILDELADFLYENPGINIEIRGHTNRTPQAFYADRLSQRRAESVLDYLVAQGISADRLTATGYGKQLPLYEEDNSQSRQKNQRVEIRLLP